MPHPVRMPHGSCAGRNLVLQQGDATVARLSLYRVFRSVHMRRRKRELVAWCAWSSWPDAICGAPSVARIWLRPCMLHP